MALVRLAVNGTLMRGEKLHSHLEELGAKFIDEDKTMGCYRLFSINDEYPGMIHDESRFAGNIKIEIYEIEEEKLHLLMEQEPKGLYLGKVVLQNGKLIYGILAKEEFLRGQKDITKFGGWKKYLKNK